ncbi:hypothetical protein GCM10011391_32920 [Pullulanibacillus camelliae]|uniref:Uncharacterized protein n=1 Tax=Pullulanibacillus camelliae TaxID=1707096 RepID=A0A8J3E0L6_9BACL|nr:hypothetical protein GCM10011391_32920 [Pullulanibacillus camelliae]
MNGIVHQDIVAIIKNSVSIAKKEINRYVTKTQDKAGYFYLSLAVDKNMESPFKMPYYENVLKSLVSKWVSVNF